MKKFLSACLLLSFAFQSKATFTPVSLTGFNADVVANGIGLPTTSTTIAYDSAGSTANYSLNSQDYQQTATSSLPTYYLPTTRILSSLVTTGLTYQLAPYNANNSLRLIGTSGTTNTGTLTFPTPYNLIGDVYIIGSSGSGSSTASVTITFSDNTTQSGGTFVFNDWFNNTPYAVGGFGRVGRSSGTLDASAGSGGNPRLYEMKITLALANYTKTIKSVTVTRTTGSATTSTLNIMAITVDHQSCLPVQNLVVSTVPTMTTAGFTWSAVSGATSYEYAIQTSATPPVTGTLIGTNSLNATGLNNGTTYYLFVRARCSGTTTSIWNSIQFSTVACPTVTASTITTSNITTVSATMNWTAVSGSAGYEWAVSTSATPPTSGTATSTNTVNLSGLNPGTLYYFYIRNNCTSPSNSLWTSKTFTTLACPVAGTPTISVNTPGTVTYSWPGSTIPGIASYQYVVTTSTATPTVWNTTNNLTATDNTLIPGTTYYIHVRSNCNTSQSTYTPLQFINPFPPCATTAPFTFSGVNMHGANITWKSSPNVVQGYQYVLKTTPATPTTGTATTDTFYVATGLVGGQKYYVFSRTLCGQNLNNVVNYSVWSMDSFTTPTTCVPTANPIASNITGSSATLSWTNYSGIYSFEYILDKNSATPSPSISGVAVNYNSLVATNLFSGTNYYFHLRVRCDTVNYSPWVTIPFTTSTVCTSTDVPSIIEMKATTAKFGWSPVAGAIQYQYSVTATPNPVWSNTYTPTNNVKVFNLQPNSSYYFHVRSFCSQSDTSSWQTINFSTYQVSASNISYNKDFEVIVYPNPVNETLNIELSGKIHGMTKMQLYDMSGKILRSIDMPVEHAELYLGDLAQGMYLLKYHDDKNSGILKVHKK
ncbi:MAG: T9SS type A sorting domain-containing protein [Bacteroidetes bacterium]|nr:T9SS type A sorting domain-containing protein [Bacteroidota bacterium]MBS1739992.1 T9SS type A sorting domain-containing protein [Bacteroidota bacterium]